jgi:opacity protein-like surface antigen
MKRVFSIFLLFIMSANVVVSLVEQLHGIEWYEANEGGTDDADDKEKSDKEKAEKEKKPDTIIYYSGLKKDAVHFVCVKELLRIKGNHLISEYHGQLPELPPEA